MVQVPIRSGKFSQSNLIQASGWLSDFESLKKFVSDAIATGGDPY